MTADALAERRSVGDAMNDITVTKGQSNGRDERNQESDMNDDHPLVENSHESRMFDVSGINETTDPKKSEPAEDLARSWQGETIDGEGASSLSSSSAVLSILVLSWQRMLGRSICLLRRHSSWRLPWSKSKEQMGRHFVADLCWMEGLNAIFWLCPPRRFIDFGVRSILLQNHMLFWESETL
jgi:hypothetical protein